MNPNPPKGEEHWRSKLTAEDARLIYAQRGHLTARQVCALYEDIINPSAVYAIWKGLNWSHATGAPRMARPSRSK